MHLAPSLARPHLFAVMLVYKGKCRSKCIIYKVEFSMCDAIYIGNTQQTLKKEWTVIYQTSYVYSRTDRNQILLLPIPKSTLILLRHVHIYVSK